MKYICKEIYEGDVSNIGTNKTFINRRIIVKVISIVILPYIICSVRLLQYDFNELLQSA